MSFDSLEAFRTALQNAPAPDATALNAAESRNGQLTKPPGALGRLESLAIWYAGWKGTDRPEINAPQIVIFAGNHGVAAQGVSAFPSDVTAQMVANFSAGGAAINQLAKQQGATLDVIPLDLDTPTADFTQTPALTKDELLNALKTGWDSLRPETDLLVVGEMGIGNTTSAAAIAFALIGGEAAEWVGRGTGVDDAGLARKQAVVEAGVARHESRDPLDVLGALGGREIAAMAGAIAHARVSGTPMILDGFICSAAALVLHKLSATALDHAVAGHMSAEGAHTNILNTIDKEPLLNLDLRLGEGSGAAVAISILKSAIACHSGMATFADAGVSTE